MPDILESLSRKSIYAAVGTRVKIECTAKCKCDRFLAFALQVLYLLISLSGVVFGKVGESERGRFVAALEHHEEIVC